MGKKHTSYRGVAIDMEMLKFQNQTATALGNANMNARGDKIGRGGSIIKTREELLAEREREMQLPDIMPEHTSHSTAPAIDDGFDDSMFEIAEVEPVQEVQAEEAAAPKKAPVKRAKTKEDTDNQE
ncbi:hypothetical protein EJP02_324 [Escherichia phage EJP2]|nr:hypothetical protein EJP02_324 [Escherichia phage EJP2]